MQDTRAISLTDLPDRDLERRELRDLATAVAASPGSWRDQVSYHDENRHFACLHRDAHVDVWLLCWTPQNDTGWHDHDISSGAVAVVEGRLIEHNLMIGGADIERIVAAGQSFDFGPDHIHRLTGLDAGSVSVHAYSPPLERLGRYDVSETGQLRRTSVSYTEELRPAGAPA